MAVVFDLGEVLVPSADVLPENVDAARAHGWAAHVWVDATAALAVVTDSTS